MRESRKLFLRCVTVLSCIALVSGLLLGLVSQITAITPEEQMQRAVAKVNALREGDYAEAETSVPMTGERGEIQSFFVDRNSGGRVYAAVIIGYRGYGGDISFTVIIEEGAVSQIAVGSNSETPGVSDAALKNEQFLNSFLRPLSELDELLNGPTDGIDSATGATYSSRGTKNAFATLAAFWMQFQQEVQP